MKLICVRHGKPEFTYPHGRQRMTARDFNRLLDAYDVAGLDPEWNRPHFAPVQASLAEPFSVSSDLPRALETAEGVLGRAADLVSADYREIPLPRFKNQERRRSGMLFMAASRLGWFTGWMSGAETRRESLDRVDRCLGEVEQLCQRHGEVAVFAHGFFLWLMGRRLLKRGWTLEGLESRSKNRPFRYLEHRVFVRAS